MAKGILGDGNDEFLVSLFGPVQQDDKKKPIPVRVADLLTLNY